MRPKFYNNYGMSEKKYKLPEKVKYPIHMIKQLNYQKANEIGANITEYFAMSTIDHYFMIYKYENKK